jgi:SCY1-like protein 2
VLKAMEAILDKLDRTCIIEEVLPIMYDVRLSDPEIVLAVVGEPFHTNICRRSYED